MEKKLKVLMLNGSRREHGNIALPYHADKGKSRIR